MQVIYGPRVSVVKSNLEVFMDSPLSDNLDSILDIPPDEPVKQKEDHKTVTNIQPEQSSLDKNTITLFAHMNGTVVPLENVADDVFSQKILGDGIAIEPQEGKLFAPCDGTIDSVFDTNMRLILSLPITLKYCFI